MSETKAKRLTRLADEIGYALGRGEFPENQLREFRFLWRTTPDQEREGLTITLKDLEEMVKSMRREQAILTGAGKVKTYQVDHVPNRPNDSC